MLARSIKIQPSLLLLILFLAFFGWQLSQGTKHEEGPVDSEVIPLEEGERRAPRVAIMTFVTEQRSYLHQVLKNKDREYPLGRRKKVNCMLRLSRLRPSPWLRPRCRL